MTTPLPSFTITFRPITPEDNTPLLALVRSVVLEFGRNDSEYLTDDPGIIEFYQQFQSPDSQYWILEDAEGQLMGGGGYGRLPGTTVEEATCEIQKMYFSPACRGKGLGKRLLRQILTDALEKGYQRFYLETVPELKAALHLYETFGFRYLDAPWGKTEHACCDVYMGCNKADLILS